MIISQLTATRRHYADSHPDIKKLDSEIAEVREIVETLPDETEEEETPVPVAVTLNPVVATIETKISVANARIISLQEHKQLLNDRIIDIEAKILLTPQVERSLKVLNRDYQNAQRRYNEIRAKQMDAEHVDTEIHEFFCLTRQTFLNGFDIGTVITDEHHQGAVFTTTISQRPDLAVSTAQAEVNRLLSEVTYRCFC